MNEYDYIVGKVFKELLDRMEKLPEKVSIPSKYGFVAKFISKDFDVRWEWSKYSGVVSSSMWFYIKDPYSGPHLLNENQMKMFDKKLSELEKEVMDKVSIDKRSKLYQKYLELFPNG